MRRLSRLWARSVDAYVASIGRVTPAAQDLGVREAVQNLLLAARALGLGAVITVWHLMPEHEWARSAGARLQR